MTPVRPPDLFLTLGLAAGLALLPPLAHAHGGARADGQEPGAEVEAAQDREAGLPQLVAEANTPGTDAVDADAGTAPILRAQVLLERARFSPGEIDGAWGSNTVRAIEGFQQRHGLEVTGMVDAATGEKLGLDTVDPVVAYTLTAADVDGPFVEIPGDMEAKAELDRLGYASALEALGEKFHASPGLLRRLNPDAQLQAGARWWVPNVVDVELPKGEKLVVDQSDAVVRLLDGEGTVLGQWPATMGSEHDPLPLGEWTVDGIAEDPVFYYNPELFWDADPSHAKAEVAPGPNNPVGTVWIDLSREHYGIHGTPEPANIGKTASHGCIRMTNWSALALARAIAPGAVVVLQE